VTAGQPTKAAAAVDQPRSPKAKERIQTLDVIRGVASLGILPVNADGFAGPSGASLNPATWLYPNQGWTAFSYWVMDAFFHDKFVTIFSMLFGVSLFLVGGEQSDRKRSRILYRRLAVLFGFAMLHGFGIWWGDILSLYAVTGFIMSFCRSWSPKRLLLVGALIYTGLALSHFPPGALPFASERARAEAVAQATPSPASIERRKAKAQVDMAEATSGWAGSYRVNDRQYLRVFTNYRFSLLATLGLMMIGLSLFKSGFMAGRSTIWRYTLTFGMGAFALAIIGRMLWQADVQNAVIPGLHSYLAILSVPVALGYAAGLMLLLKTRVAPMLAPFAAAGRMAFTNYLSQSLIMTSIFFGGRGALMGKVDRPALWAIIIAIWALQLVWSPIWLSRFEMGPFEWVWRCLTLGRRVPILKPR
jgi:uncharacterized protein